VRAWIDRLTARERLALLLGGVLLVAVLIFAFLWQPFAARHARVSQVVTEQRALLEWMTRSAAGLEARRSESALPTRGLAEGQSLLGLVDATARAAGLAGQVTRVQPEGADGVRVWMDRVSFDRLILWLARLEAEAGVQTESVTVEATDRPGEVNARLGLKREGGGAS
jgi:general secretion pathway protein M